MEKIMIKNNIIDKEVEYTFRNVTQLKKDEWLTTLSGKEIANLWNEGTIVYNPNTQRGTTVKRNKQGELEEVAVYSLKNVKEIQKKIISGDYYPDTIVLNVIKNDKNKLTVEGNDLKVEGQINILDGQHRCISLSLIQQSNNIVGDDSSCDLSKLMFPIKITNYNVEQSQQQFYQYQLGLKISRSKAESFNKKDGVNRIVTALNTHGALKDKIDTNKTSIAKNDETHIVTFSTLVEAIKQSFGIMSNETREKEVLNFLLVYFEELFKIFPELSDHEARTLSKQYALTCENFMFYGYIELAALLYLDRNDGKVWKSKLQKLDDMNFSKLEEDELNPIWSSVLRLGVNGKVAIINNKTTRRLVGVILKEQFMEN